MKLISLIKPAVKREQSIKSQEKNKRGQSLLEEVESLVKQALEVIYTTNLEEILIWVQTMTIKRIH